MPRTPPVACRARAVLGIEGPTTRPGDGESVPATTHVTGSMSITLLRWCRICQFVRTLARKFPETMRFRHDSRSRSQALGAAAALGGSPHRPRRRDADAGLTRPRMGDSPARSGPGSGRGGVPRPPRRARRPGIRRVGIATTVPDPSRRRSERRRRSVRRSAAHLSPRGGPRLSRRGPDSHGARAGPLAPASGGSRPDVDADPPQVIVPGAEPRPLAFAQLAGLS
jgi:hypothetical protein